MEYKVGDHEFLKISPWKGVIRFCSRGKSNPCYIGPFPIIERIGLIVYCLEPLTELEKIHNGLYISVLKKYMDGPSHTFETSSMEL